MTAPSVTVGVKRLPHGEGLPLPAYQSAGAAGLDLLAALPPDSKIVIEPGGRYLVQTGIVLSIPVNYEAQVRPRSGLARDHGVTVLNAPGTIDSDYRGEVLILLINHGDEPFEIVRGARVAQLIVAPLARVTLTEQDEVDTTLRAGNGFGSTGGHAGLEERR
ncbi:MAG: dUTP diphosphatase [Beijerinckiaceae bacterium]|nr:dUTP diphosphatase [Beijerinckiaceae bacterium]